MLPRKNASRGWTPASQALHALKGTPTAGEINYIPTAAWPPKIAKALALNAPLLKEVYRYVIIIIINGWAVETICRGTSTESFPVAPSFCLSNYPSNSESCNVLYTELYTQFFYKQPLISNQDVEGLKL